jgi:hypothetical protein
MKRMINSYPYKYDSIFKTLCQVYNPESIELILPRCAEVILGNF